MNKKNIVITIVMFVAIAASFYFFKSSAMPTQEVVKNDNQNFNIVIKDKKITSGPEVIKAIQGQTVSIKFLADVSDEIHVHGLDKHLDLEAGKEGTMTFLADKAGSFPYELEAAKADLGSIEVQPN